MRRFDKWIVWILAVLTSACAMGQQENEIFPQIADDGTVVWQIATPLDLFQRVGISNPWLPDGTIGIRIFFPTGPFPVGQVPEIDFNSARPQISANGQWLIHHDGIGRVLLWQVLIDNISGNKTLVTTPTQLVIRQQQVIPSGILPLISGDGRIIVFLSQNPDLHDPDGDSDPNNNDPPNPPSPPAGLWLIYIHDRDADGDGVFDELEEGATRTSYLNVPSPNPPFVRLTEVRLGLNPTGATLAFSLLTQPQPGIFQWELWFVPNVQDVQNNPPQRVAISSAPFSVPSVVGAYLAFTASGPFNWDQVVPPTPPVAGIHVVNMLDLQRSLVIETNGVSGAPVLSHDGNLLAFHTTGTMYRINGSQWWLFSDFDRNGSPEDFNGDAIPDFDRNGVDDVFVFDLTPMLQPSPAPPIPVWSTLIIRSLGVGNPPIGPFVPCINPALPSSSVNLIALQEVVNGQSRVSIVDTQTNTVVR